MLAPKVYHDQSRGKQPRSPRNIQNHDPGDATDNSRNRSAEIAVHHSLSKVGLTREKRVKTHEKADHYGCNLQQIARVV